MATISSPGLGSGLDINSIVSQLVAVERQPLQQLQKRASTLQTQLSAFGQLKSQLSTLSDAATKLASATAWGQMQGSSADSTAVAATITSTEAPEGSLQVHTQHLATTQAVASGALPAAGAVGTGKLIIQAGSWNTAGDTFTPSGAAAVEIDIAADGNTPAAIAAKVNAAGAGITATTVTDASGAHLVFRSSATGQAGGFTIATDVAGATSGLDRLTYSASTGGGALQKTQSASDAIVSINGVTVTSASNRLDSTIAGVTLTLSKETAAPVEVTIAPDKTSRRALIDDFIKAYNALNANLSTSTAYNADTKTAGTLQADRAALSMQSALRSTLRSTLPSGTYTQLADAGLEQQRDGSLKVNESKLAAAMAQGTDLGKLFNVAGTSGVTDGIANRLKTLTTGLLNTDGTVTTRTSALQDAARRNSTDQDKLNTRLTAVEARLRAQYSALDKSMSGLNALSSYVSQQVTLWNKASG